MRRVGRDGVEAVYRLYLRGRATPVVVKTSGAPPDVNASRGPGDLVYGNVTYSESGAYTVFVSVAFISHRGHFIQRDQYAPKNRRGSQVLFTPVQPGIWSGGGSALLYDGRRLVEIGAADDAWLNPDGSVSGWYLASQGKPFHGLEGEAPHSIYRQYFVWRNGVRTLTGRR